MTNNSNDTTTPDKCPHCGAGVATAHRGGISRFYQCQNRIEGGRTRPAYCREREARQKLEARIDRINNDNFNLANMLSKAESEVARLKYTLEEARADRNRAGLEERKKFLPLLREKEAEVARLQTNLRRAIEIAKWFDENSQRSFISLEASMLRDELDAIKSTLNPETK